MGRSLFPAAPVRCEGIPSFPNPRRLDLGTGCSDSLWMPTRKTPPPAKIEGGFSEPFFSLLCSCGAGIASSSPCPPGLLATNSVPGSSHIRFLATCSIFQAGILLAKSPSNPLPAQSHLRSLPKRILGELSASLCQAGRAGTQPHGLWAPGGCARACVFPPVLGADQLPPSWHLLFSRSDRKTLGCLVLGASHRWWAGTHLPCTQGLYSEGGKEEGLERAAKRGGGVEEEETQHASS